ncbi:MAG TPA: S66 peptidase family protein [Intrasporangium sp.]|uniref:S66 family peptidase n=1 Tax=Intrasporangium sp. TaxID=1925024 RepID=UPI002D76EF02|nr:S66 peptidase family protein [Intrasporangium sp.]HET7398575.1 S66 peptidase family protein [Intrasporangium sp.]
MPIRYPAPLQPGDCIGVTAPSSGVSPEVWPRLDFAVRWLRERGFDVVLGKCLGSPTQVSAPREDRAKELQDMLTDPDVRCVIPPWGGETGIDILPLLDFEAIAAAEPTWAVGFADTSTWLTPLTVLTGVATVHGDNLMDSPYAAEAGVLHWLDVVTATPGTDLDQRSPGRYSTAGLTDWGDDTVVGRYVLDAEGGWLRIDEADPDEPVNLSGRLIGGCVETLSHLTGTAYGNMREFARTHAEDGTLHYLDIDAWGAYDVCRALHGMRMAGWFEGARGILVSRTDAPDEDGFTRHDAIRDALCALDVPILANIECGHVPPRLALVNGARATVTFTAEEQSIRQTLS